MSSLVHHIWTLSNADIYIHISAGIYACSVYTYIYLFVYLGGVLATGASSIVYTYTYIVSIYTYTQTYTYIYNMYETDPYIHTYKHGHTARS